jgi:hypothetical protein
LKCTGLFDWPASFTADRRACRYGATIAAKCAQPDGLSARSDGAFWLHHILDQLRVAKSGLYAQTRRPNGAPACLSSLWLSQHPPLKLRGYLVEPLFCLLRAVSINLNLDFQLSKPSL